MSCMGSSSSSHMRVLVLSQHFDPEPITRPLDVSLGLAGRGHSVEVLTGFPYYPLGHLYPGYRLKLIQRDVISGIPVTRVVLYPSHSKSSLARIVSYGSFMVSAVFGSLFMGPCDVIYVRHPPLTVGVSAWLIGLLKGVPFVFDVQDIWPESGVWSGMLKDGPLVRALKVLEKFVYRRASHLLVVTEAGRQNLIGKGVEPEKVSIASQLIDEKSFAAPDPARVLEIKKKYGLTGRFVVMFAGNIGLVQGLDAAIDAASQLADEPSVRFVLVGGGVERERLMRRAEELRLANVTFIDHRTEAEMPDFMAAADAMLLSLRYSELCEYLIPLKTFAYMAASRPIIAAIKGAAADLVAKAGAGPVIEPGDPKALAEEVRRLMRLPEAERTRFGTEGRRYMITHHSKEKMLDEYVSVISRVCARNRGR